MAKARMINTRIWSDNWVSQLDPIEKLLFLYFLTNGYTNISGIYELPLKVAAVETGIDPTMIEKVLPRLRPKIYTHNGWVIIPNFPRYQNTENPKIMAGIQRELALVPQEIYSLSIAYGYPITLNLTKLNLTKDTFSDEKVFSPSEVSEVKLDHQGQEVVTKEKLPRRDSEAWALMGKAIKVIEVELGTTPVTGVKEYQAVLRARKHLNDKQLLEMVSYAIEDGSAEKKGLSLAAILSNIEINKYKMRQ